MTTLLPNELFPTERSETLTGLDLDSLNYSLGLVMGVKLDRVTGPIEILPLQSPGGHDLRVMHPAHGLPV